MLSANVLCLKKRKKKKTYSLPGSPDNGKSTHSTKGERSRGVTVTMMQITEDTPPDMLAGAMDLTVHLPSGRAVKMSVERSTPMMDLLVQITTSHQLQLSNHTLQALSMAPSSEYSDKILPFKPNTPIGALDTQHVQVIPKSKSLPVPKNIAPGHQPFESTFRLKVHLPRNQLYVTRVSRNFLLEDIMKKVCEEKNLDPRKYDFKHPGNLDEVLDPKLTLSDYQITEIYVVQKGNCSAPQAFSTNDIMVLRKEEERKQMHNKTGGGVLNLIFRRGKSSMGSGSVSSDNRSISPTQSDDSRSVTPPGVQQTILPKKDPPPERPKPPQRKRRPAPKPPQLSEQSRRNSIEKPPSSISDGRNEAIPKKTDTGLTISHSRNSSDSSGYHEASILSDNCNTSLPRRPKSAFVNSTDVEKMLGEHSQSTTNLSKMSNQSKSTTSLAGRKKKAAPPPPSQLRAATSVVSLEKPSPLVASQPTTSFQDNAVQEQSLIAIHNPRPLPRTRSRPIAPPRPRPKSEILFTSDEKDSTDSFSITSSTINLQTTEDDESLRKNQEKETINELIINEIIETQLGIHNENKTEKGGNDIQTGGKANRPCDQEQDDTSKAKQDSYQLTKLQKTMQKEIFSSSEFLGETKPPEVVAMIPKTPNISPKFDSLGKKRCFKIGSSLLEQNFETITLSSNDSKSEKDSSRNSYSSALDAFQFVDEISDVNNSLFSGSLSKSSKAKKEIFNQLYGMHDLDQGEEYSACSLPSLKSLPSEFYSNMKKWDNNEQLDDIPLSSLGTRTRWVAGDTSDAESLPATTITSPSPLEILKTSSLTTTSSQPINFVEPVRSEDKSLDSTDSGISPDSEKGHVEHVEKTRINTPPPPPILDDISLESPLTKLTPKPVEEEIQKVEKAANDAEEIEIKEDIDWQYQLPSPPKAFRDTSPARFTDITTNRPNSVTDLKTDSVVTSPELFEKLKHIEDSQSEKETLQSEATSEVGEDDKPLSTLSLDILEKRKSLVYNRELATSLKMTDALENQNIKTETFTSSLTKFETTYEDIRRSSLPKQQEKPVQKSTNTLPNFKLTTYDVPKQKIKVFEDDTVRSNTDAFRTSISSSKINFTRNNLGRSTENIFPRKDSFDFQENERSEKEYRFFKSPKPINSGPISNIFRSESFSVENGWSPSKPVCRSKSQLTLTKYRQQKLDNFKSQDGLSKSNSLLDVSGGLQSLEVMKLIQNKLSTPTSSMENINHREISHSTDSKPEIMQNTTPKLPKETPKIYKYAGPPSINMSTWSERPKIPVAVKEDADYKLGNANVSSKLIVNTTNNNLTSSNSYAVKTNYTSNSNSSYTRTTVPSNVSIKVNGTTEHVTQNSNNIVIKIGGGYSEDTIQSNTKKYSTTFRRPFGNIEKNIAHRPHSIAFDSELDISRVPVVRSVEFKKPFKDIQNNNTSVTQIHSDLDNKNKYSNSYRSNDALNGTTRTNHDAVSPPKQVTRVNSFKPSVTPTVKGFQTQNEPNHRFSWNPSNFSTVSINGDHQKDYITNKNVPFSQSNLRRTDSNRMINNGSEAPPSSVEILNHKNNAYNNNFNAVRNVKQEEVKTPPPPPMMPKVNLKKVPPKQIKTVQNSDPRDLLLESIRNFGGKKGLRAAKA